MLLFKKVFHDAIIAGTKTTTLRYWRYQRVKPGSIHTVPRLGRVRIESVQRVEMADLTADHARDDGFESLADLHAALAEMYGPNPETSGRQLFLVHFTYPA